MLELADSLVLGDVVRLLHSASRAMDYYFRMYVYGFRERNGTD